MSDYTTVYFTAFDRGFNIPAVAAQFHIFGLDVRIRWYGILIATGFLLALIYCSRLAKRWHMNTDKFYDAIIFGTIGAVIGARLYYVLFEWEYYAQYPADIFRIYEGGLAIYGGLIGGILAAYIVCRVNKLNFLKLLDIVSVGFLIGQGIGRWGNFTNQEAFGTNTFLPWGMTSEKVSAYIAANQAEFLQKGFTVDPYIPVHPTFLYESLWCLSGAIVLNLICKRFKKFDGQIILMYGIWYGFGRMVIEGLRTDSLYIASTGIRVSQLLSALIIIACVVVLIIKIIEARKQENTFVLDYKPKEQ